MSAPDAEVVTRTTVTTPSPDDHDGVLPEPTEQQAAPLWYALVGCLCIILLAMAGTFVYLAVEGAIDSAALVGLFGLVLAAVMDLYRRRKG